MQTQLGTCAEQRWIPLAKVIASNEAKYITEGDADEDGIASSINMTRKVRFLGSVCTISRFNPDCRIARCSGLA
jgi:hypothetical protein